MEAITLTLEQQDRNYLGRCPLLRGVPEDGIARVLDEPGADLPVVLAVASSYRDAPIADDLTAIGEVGLTGEIRTVSHLNQRLGEVARLGFKKCIIPKGGSEKLDIPEGLTVYRVRNLREAIEVAL